ncbi:MAG: hypothetical protein JSW55_10505 [Chloroflexota bacterium]|nr:MAG: hypothetical protein JSW55_10505 [Chloroflexota bacterium]
MPAYRERIYICPDENARPAWITEFPLWWDRRAFFEEYGDRRIDTGNPFYVDYGLLLTGSEARAWDKRCREAFASDPHSQEPHNVEALHRLESMLRDASWVIVESSEWESGLD